MHNNLERQGSIQREREENIINLYGYNSDLQTTVHFYGWYLTSDHHKESLEVTMLTHVKAVTTHRVNVLHRSSTKN